MKNALVTLGVAVATASIATAASAGDRNATPGEQARIGSILQANGYTSWDEIEYDDKGYFEVDDARHVDGRAYDLKIRDGRIIKKKLD